MKKIAFLLLLVSLGAANLHADDQIAAVQQDLKEQGYFYGQVDGQAGPETTAAIRRYQIRNGLHVDGSLNKETLASLKIAGQPGASAAPAIAGKNAPLPPKPAPLDADAQPPQQQQATPPVQDLTQSDREFLRKQTGAVASSAPAPVTTPVAPPETPDPATSDDSGNQKVVPPPVNVPQQEQAPSQQLSQGLPPVPVQYASLFARTPYQNAPVGVQQDTLRTAQMRLARRNFYSGDVDGIPGPVTAGAIVAFQGKIGLSQTGRLDFPTLRALHLLPSQGPVQAQQRRVIVQPFYPPPRYYYYHPRVVFRNFWGD